MIARVSQLTQSSFLRAVAVLSGGQGIAMALPILAAPILGRLYLPADYGALAIYMAPAAILGVLASLQLQHAIIAEATNRTASYMGALTLASAAIVGGLCAGAVALLWPWVFGPSAAGLWFVALPLSVLAGGIIATGTFTANRHRRYRFIALLQVAQVALTVALSIGLGVLGWGKHGLLASYLLGQAVQAGGYIWILTRPDMAPTWPGTPRLRVLVRRHWKFPVFSLPSGLSSQINMQMPVLALSALGADGALGAFTRARQLVSMPVTLVGQSVGQVFRRDASELYRTTGSCRRLMLKTAGGMFAVGALPCAIFMVFAPWLFTIYLGPAWREAGEIARILAPMLLLRSVSGPVSTVFFFTANQVLDLKLMAGATAMIGLSTCAALWVFGTALSVIYVFSIGYALFYCVQFLVGLQLAEAPPRTPRDVARA